MEPALDVAGVKRGNVWYWPPEMVVRAAHEGVGLSNSWFHIAELNGVKPRHTCAAMRGLRRIELPRLRGKCADSYVTIGPLVGQAKVRGMAIAKAGDCAWRSRSVR